MKNDFYIQWHITNKCNLRCQHCYQDDFTSSEDLSWPLLKKISNNLLETLKDWRRKAKITLTGGEPFLKKELFLLLDYLDRKDLINELEIITNGILINNNLLESLKKFHKLKRLKISLEGACSSINDMIRGEATFSKVCNVIERIKKQRRFKINIMFTILKSNIKEITSTLKFAKELKIEGVIIERFLPLGQAKRLKDQTLSSEEWQKIVELLTELCRICCPKEDLIHFRAFWIKFDSYGKLRLLGAPCTVAEEGFCIMPKADIFPCRRLDIPIGNLLRDSLKEIWENSFILKALRSRDSLKGKCGQCQISFCRGCRAAAHALKKDYLAEDPHCYL